MILNTVICCALFFSCTEQDDDSTNLPPSKVEIAVDSLGYNSAVLSWSEAIDPDGSTVTYSIILDDDEILSDTSDTSVKVDSLLPDTQYSFQVNVMDTEGGSSNSAISFTTLEKENLPPSTFQVIVGNIEEDGAIVNRIGDSTDPEGGAIRYSIYLNGILVVDNLESSRYPFTNLEPDTEYIGTFVATDTDGQSTSIPFSFTTQKNNMPPVIENLEYTVFENGFEASWTISDQDSTSNLVNLYIDADQVLSLSNNNSFSIDTLASGNYSIRLVALDSDGGVSEETFDITIAQPENQAPVFVGGLASQAFATPGQVSFILNLSWAATDDNDMPLVDVLFDGNVMASGITTNAFSFTGGLGGNTSVTVELRATDTEGATSTLTEQISFQTWPEIYALSGELSSPPSQAYYLEVWMPQTADVPSMLSITSDSEIFFFTDADWQLYENEGGSGDEKIMVVTISSEVYSTISGASQKSGSMIYSNGEHTQTIDFRIRFR